MGESTDVSFTTPLAAFVLGIGIRFSVTEELAALMPMKGTITGADLYE
jgi:hypothetical protein